MRHLPVTFPFLKNITGRQITGNYVNLRERYFSTANQRYLKVTGPDKILTFLFREKESIVLSQWFEPTINLLGFLIGESETSNKYKRKIE